MTEEELQKTISKMSKIYSHQSKYIKLLIFKAFIWTNNSKIINDWFES